MIICHYLIWFWCVGSLGIYTEITPPYITYFRKVKYFNVLLSHGYHNVHIWNSYWIKILHCNNCLALMMRQTDIKVLCGRPVPALADTLGKGRYCLHWTPFLPQGRMGRQGHRSSTAVKYLRSPLFYRVVLSKPFVSSSHSFMRWHLLHWLPLVIHTTCSCRDLLTALFWAIRQGQQTENQWSP